MTFGSGAMSWSRFRFSSLLRSDLDARFVIISIPLLSLSLHTFRWDTALIVIAIVTFFTRGRALIGLLYTSPLIVIFSFWSLLFGGFFLIPTVVALFSIGFLSVGLTAEEIGYALMYFRFPPKIAYSLCFSMRFLRLSIVDLQNVLDVLSLENVRGFRYYLHLLKALTSLMILRAFSTAVSLYSRGFDLDRRIVFVKKPGLWDFGILLCSILCLMYSIYRGKLYI